MSEPTIETFDIETGGYRFRIEWGDRVYQYQDGVISYSHRDGSSPTEEVVSQSMRREIVDLLRKDTHIDLPFYETNRQALETEKGFVFE